MKFTQPRVQPEEKLVFRGLLFALFLLLPALVSAQSADKIIKQSVRAMGGEKALRAVRSWQVKGTITRKGDGATGSYQAATMLPNLYAGAFDVNGAETSVGYNGKSGWVRDTQSGLRTLTGAASRDFQAEALYRNTRRLDYKKEKAKLTSGGTATVNDKPTNTVILTTAKGVRLKMYFDATAGLLVREGLPAGPLQRVFDYSDYRLVDGVMEPHAVSISVGNEQYDVRLSEIRHNLPLDRALFDFPKVSNEPLPDIAQLRREVKENGDKLDELLEKYTYTETISKREMSSAGQLQEKGSKAYELTFYQGNRIRRLLEKNGRPLAAEEMADENERVEKRVREIEKKEAEKERKAQKEREVAQAGSGSPEMHPAHPE